MVTIKGFLFLLSILIMGKYLAVFLINFLSNPPKKMKMRYYKDIAVDEMIIYFVVSYFFTYIIF